LIQREVSVALRRNWITESALITITRATISPDLRQVRVGYAVSGGDPEKKAARTFLKRIRRELRAAVSGILQMKNAPELILAEDDVTGGVARVQALLDEMSRKEKPAASSDSDE
jgi:ribosome-binding factor A